MRAPAVILVHDDDDADRDVPRTASGRGNADTPAGLTDAGTDGGRQRDSRRNPEYRAGEQRSASSQSDAAPCGLAPACANAHAARLGTSWRADDRGG